MRMTDSDLAAIVRRELTQARGYDSDVLSSVRANALNLYNGKMTAAPEGRSQIVSLDVADSIHATLAQISPVIRTSQIEFEAQSQEDELQAQTETDFTRVTIERSGGYDMMDDAAFDALLTGNGWLHAYVDTSKQVTEQRFPGQLSDEEVYVITNTAPPDIEISIKQGKDYAVAKVTKTVKRLIIEVPAPEDMLFAEQGSDFDVDQLRFIARRRLYTASQLRDRGISQQKIDDLQDAFPDADGERARQGVYQNDGDYLSVEDANRLKVVYCCYIRLQTGRNETELRHVWIGETGNDVLINEPAEFVPYITGSAIPMPHRITGTSITDKIESIQRGKTHVLRQFMDNLMVMNASRIGAVEGQVNMSDLTNGRINGVVRMRSPDALVPLPAADIGPQAVGALEYLDTVRTQRVGSSLDFNEVQAQLMGTSATAAAGQLSKVEQMGGWFAGNLVRTLMLPLFTLVHRILRTEMAGPVMARIGGKWQQADTSQWQERTVTDIQLGLTTTEKAERLLALNQTISQMTGMMQAGGSGVITDLPRLYNAMGDWIRTANLGNPDQYLIDPNSPEAQQAQQRMAEQQQQQATEQVRMEAELIKLNQNFDLEKQRRELEYKVWSDKLDAEIKEADMVSKGAIEIKKLNMTKEEPDDEDA